MQPWIELCENWLSRQYRAVLGMNFTEGPARLRWLSADSLTTEVPRDAAQGIAVLDSDIGWMLFLLPYESHRLEHQANEALGLRSQLLREFNYSGDAKVGEKEDADGSWRVGIVWLVDANMWKDWQHRILEIRRESGAAEEISFDAVQVNKDEVLSALDKHGLPRLLLHTRALLSQSAAQSEKWLSANAQILSILKGFSQQFDTPRTRTFAREFEKQKNSFETQKTGEPLPEARRFRRFCVKHFRNIDDMDVVIDQSEGSNVQSIVLFGPNGTGKSSFGEALSLAAFGTSPEMEKFTTDADIKSPSTDTYLKDYLTPLNAPDAKPRFILDKSEETLFNLDRNEDSRRKYEGIVLDQESSIKFTEMHSEQLAAHVLRGYSALADSLSDWLTQEEKRANDTKLTFTRKYGLSGAIKLSATAYERLAQGTLQQQLHRPTPEFLNWLRFWTRMTDEDGQYASKLVSDWTNQQDAFIGRLSATVAKLQGKGASPSQISDEIRATLDEFDVLAKQSSEFRQRLESRLVALRDQIDRALTHIDVWGEWLASRSSTVAQPEADTQGLKAEIERLAKERTEVERDGKVLRSRIDLLDQSKQFLLNHWGTQHPNTCPVCNSDVSERQGIEKVVSTLQQETSVTIQTLRTRFIEIQNRQKDLDAKIKATGLAICPLANEDQARLRGWLTPFLPDGVALEDSLPNPQQRERLKEDLKRMKVLPDAPKTYADTAQEADRLAGEFVALAQEADSALEDPQSIGQVRKVFEQRLETVLKEHLPTTLGRVWQEITLTLTTASWLLPDKPSLKIDRRGKALSVQTKETGRYIRYLFNAAERHVLGLAWFFTYYLARRRFEEAWVLLDDPAQEMDQPSFRELVRFWETMLRLNKRLNHPFTLIVALNQEERALDTARATNGKLYILGWANKQQDLGDNPSIKKVVLLAPGFHPLKPERLFRS